MNRRENKCLIASSACCFLAALAHLGCIVFGADWYRMFGAGEAMAQMAEQGLWYPTLVTLTIAAILCFWCIFALAGAGVIKKLPFTRSIYAFHFSSDNKCFSPQSIFIPSTNAKLSR
ncbi:hypothetical protein [Vibrio rotiferianus]|uniref:hypothetical protein n=1 Tax=Vibrio rotiferianus TaxID=190895 RepID=UPI001F0EB453|nr:hypothetical protein [Vibrio rotiferianus]